MVWMSGMGAAAGRAFKSFLGLPNRPSRWAKSNYLWMANKRIEFKSLSV